MDPNLRVRMILFALLFNIFLALGMMTMMEGCTIEIETEPIELQVEITASLECEEEDLMTYLTLPVCVLYDYKECCNIAWSSDCVISFCEDCIGVTSACSEDEE